jgi:hypothetical protein
MWQFYKLDVLVRGKLVAKKVAVSHGVRHQLMTPPPTAGKQATAGMLATARILVATGTPAVSKGHQQQPDLCGKSKKSDKK